MECRGNSVDDTALSSDMEGTTLVIRVTVPATPEPASSASKAAVGTE
ncbi:hypothetical protein [Halopolyspora algeriensis]|nr:hypothetical protein [Halopolyspora algeriensis]